MLSTSLYKWVLTDVRMHCQKKGYREGTGVNNFVPHDCVAAFNMAKLLIKSKLFEYYVAIAPEGHVYGYFLESLGVKVLSVHVDYPPTKLEIVDDLTAVQGKRVLLIEDDVISGSTLRLVVSNLQQYRPRSLSLYLGHTKEIQQLLNVPPEIRKIYIAEDCLDPLQREQHEAEFSRFFVHISSDMKSSFAAK